MFTSSIVLLMIINTVAASGAVFVALQASALDTGDRVSASTASAPHATGITAELPDLDEKDVSLEIANGVLSISGEKKSESEDKARRFTGGENRTMLSAYFQSEQFDRKRLSLGPFNRSKIKYLPPPQTPALYQANVPMSTVEYTIYSARGRFHTRSAIRHENPSFAEP